MNLKDALDTANWLLERELVAETEPQKLLKIRQMRDTIWLLYAAAGIPEIILRMYDDKGYPG